MNNLPEGIPLYLSILFIVCTLYTLIILYVASNKSNKVLLVSLGWIVLQGVLAYQLFYTDTSTMPPNFVFALAPTLIFIAFLFLTKKGKEFISSINLKSLYLVHVVRIPVEFGLLGLAIYKVVPYLMTFEGVNFDIFAGITVPIIILGYFVKDWFSDSFVLFWNIICLGLLIGIVVNAILSVPSSLQTQAFEQPNIAILYFPYVWLASYIVPVVIFAHLVSIKRAYSK
ncbi:hypothetical protein N9544_05780 [Flavobacteriales bacterium]|nr:hypothetical protein [Flavobacteriales bacterium]